MLRHGLLLARKRAILDFVDAQHRGGTDDFLDPRRIVHAGELHQDLKLGVGAAVLLNYRLSQAKIVDPVADRLD